MKKFALGIALAGALLPACAKAQVMIDMTRVTCADYLALPDEDSKIYSAWMSGWFNHKLGYTLVDLDAYARNVANVKQWCASNPKESVMAGLQRSAGKMK